MNLPDRQSRRQRGFTFVEISVVLLLLGIVSAIVAQIVPAMRRASLTADTVRQLSNVQSSLQAFAAIHARLPCADTDGDGLEEASPCATVGQLPYLTMGQVQPLLNADGYPFRYGVYDGPAATLRSTAQLGRRTERYRPSIGSGSTVTLTDKAYADSNRRLDFCQGLRAGMDATFDARYLHIETTRSNRKHVAYVLVDPGLGNMDLLGDRFDGRNGTASGSSPRFDHPNRAQSLTYDDRVVVAYFDALWQNMGCSGNMATAGRAHPNIETTLALIKQSSVDYATQLDIAVDAAFADNFAAGAGIASATAGLLSASAAIPTGIASAINTFGVTSGAPISAGVAVGLNAVNLGLAIANQVLTVQNFNEFKSFRDEFNDMVNTRLNPLYQSVQSNVSRSLAKVYADE